MNSIIDVSDQSLMGGQILYKKGDKATLNGKEYVAIADVSTNQLVELTGQVDPEILAKYFSPL